MKDFSKRLLLFIQHTGLSNNKFGEACGLSGANIHQMVNAKGFGVDKLLKILNTYPELNSDWLFSGDGKMLKGDTPEGEEIKQENAHPIAHPSAHPNTKNDNGSEYSASHFQAPQVVTVDSCGQENIVMLDAKAAAGFPANIDNPQYFKDQPSMCIPTHQFKSGSFIAIQATGDSMHPTVYNHDWLFCKYLEDPLNNIREGYIHVLLTKEGVVVKRLLNRIQERGTVVCQSDNQQYPSYEERLDNILQIWKVEAKLSFILRNEGAEVNNRLNTLEADMVEIKRFMKGNGKSV